MGSQGLLASATTSSGCESPESLESLRAQRDQLADFVRELVADNPRTMALDGDAQRTALDLLDSLPVPERCLSAAADAPAGGHVYFLPTGSGTRCLNCRSLRPRADGSEHP